MVPDPAANDASLEVSDYEGAFVLLAAMAEDFSASFDMQGTVSKALRSIVEYVDAEAGSLWLLSEDGEELNCLASVGANPITGLRLPANQGIVGRTVQECDCQRVLDTSLDPNFSSVADEHSGMRTRSLVCSPLTFGNRAIGAVQVVNKRSGSGCFVPADAALLKILAASAGLAIANSRLVESERGHQRVRRDLELAAEIQRGLLPSRRAAPFPAVGMNLPARMVSGDFFDIVPLPGDRIGFCLGDVSGKGIYAALLMAKTASLYRCLAKDIASPGELLVRLNAEVCETATRGMFVTMFAGVYETRDGGVVVANAGHEPALFHQHSGGFGRVEAQAPPIGILSDTEFPEEKLALDGGALYVCSDGLTEACADGQELGSEGFQRLVERYAGKPLAERVDAIAAEAQSFELRDDLTLLAISDAERCG
jgi:sigma-B regulation protein RsbU (phosphoserine phosphatase)